MFEGRLTRVRALEPSDGGKYTDWMNRTDLAALSGTYVFPVLYDQPVGQRMSFRELAVETLDGQFIGTLVVTNFDWQSRSIELGAMIGEDDYRHQGYFRDALVLLLDHLFFQVGLVKIWGYTKETNTTVLGISKHYQVEPEARIRVWEFYRGRLIDGILFNVTRDEYKMLRRVLTKGLPSGGSSEE